MDKLRMLSMDKGQKNIQKAWESVPNTLTEILRDDEPSRN